MSIGRHSMTRRGLLGTSAALAGGLALGSHRTQAAAPRAQAGTLSGQIVISISANPKDPVKQALVDAYKAVQPGVEVIWETQTRTPGDYSSWLGTQLAAGEIRPDVVSTNYVATYRGYVNLDQYRTATNPYTGNAWDQDIDWDFYRGISLAGERIMLATRSVHINWFYNKDLFTKAGVEPPTTWTEFVDVCTKLDAAGITPVSSNYDWQVPQWFAEVYFDQYHTDWVETVRVQDGDWNYDPALDGVFVFDAADPNLHNKYNFSPQRYFQAVRDGVLRYDTPQVAEIAGNMAQIFPKYATGDFFVVGDNYPAFLQQQAAIMPNGTWSLPTLVNDLKALSPERLEELGVAEGSVTPFEWGTFENPTMEGDLVTSPVRSVESATGEYIGIINKNQEQTDLCVDFMMFWLSKAGYQPYLDASKDDPAATPGGPLQVRDVTDLPIATELFANIPMLGNAEVSYTGAWTSAGAGDFRTGLRTLFKDVLEGSITPEDYATKLQAYYEDNFATVLEQSSLTDADLDDPSRQPGT